MQLMYLAHTQLGFQAIAAQEITERLEGAAIDRTHTIANKNGMIWFSYAGAVQNILKLRTIEDLFVIISTVADMPATKQGLSLLEHAVSRSRSFDPALRLFRQIWPNRKMSGKIPFRVIARQATKATYRRVDAQRVVERSMRSRPDHRWRLHEIGALEFWLTILKDEAILALRLSDDHLRHRDYKSAHLPASLRPSVAAALAWLTKPSDADVFLDPMCGAGTILIERAHLGKYRLLLGGDLREEALSIAHNNIGPRYKPIEIRQWDARQLPLDSAAISAAAVNLPFGRQLGTPEQNRELYPAFLREMVRVLRPGSRFVTLTGDSRTFTSSLQRVSKLSQIASYSVSLLGHTARVYVLEHR